MMMIIIITYFIIVMIAEHRSMGTTWQVSATFFDRTIVLVFALLHHIDIVPYHGCYTEKKMKFSSSVLIKCVVTYSF